MTRDERQSIVAAWIRSTFGEVTCTREERTLRFLEEAIELAQAEGLSLEQVNRLMIHVYNKPRGVAEQEVGGVGITLLAYCECIGISADAAELLEWERVSAIDAEYFRRRHNKKADVGIAVRVSER